jgi:hypothetical protein
MPEVITQEILRRVLAGEVTYSDFVTNMRRHVHARARVEDGPLTVDVKALWSESALPLRIIVPSRGLTAETRSPIPQDNGPAGNVQNFMSLLAQNAGPERRRAIVQEYGDFVYGYRVRMKFVVRTRRRSLSAGIGKSQAGRFLSDAAAFRWTILRLQAAGILYASGFSPRGALARPALAAIS